MHIVVVTHIASPYQAELFNTIAERNGLELEVVYVHRKSRFRLWTDTSLFHRAVFLDDKARPFETVRATILSADLAIFNYYAERSANELLNARAASGRPWAFWGERPGFHKPEWLGNLRRKWKLAQLHASQAPIWGIGQFAVDQYKTEFGRQRDYYNLPYFSDLERFQSIVRKPKPVNSERVFLFSGSLIHRKGVDLLARAFVRLASEIPNVRLKLMGDGELLAGLAQTLRPVSDSVEFLGFKDWQELPCHYAEADVLCVPSRYDGWGLVVPEGLAAGLPVIGTNQMGAAIEFIKTGCNGWLLPAGDEQALFAALRQAALLSPEKLSELSRNARESIGLHSLQHGAERFTRAAHGVFANWESLS